MATVVISALGVLVIIATLLSEWFQESVTTGPVFVSAYIVSLVAG
jgi:hypothetical protein